MVGIKPMRKEIWKDVVGWEDSYQVSNMGNIKSKPRSKYENLGKRIYGNNILNPFTYHTGYLAVNLKHGNKRKAMPIHRLVLLSFVGNPPEGYHACHNNGIRADNRLCNLRWDTAKNNQADRFIHGTAFSAGNNPAAKLNWEIVENIRKSEERNVILAKKYKVSPSTIGAVKKHKTWRCMNYNLSSKNANGKFQTYGRITKNKWDNNQASFKVSALKELIELAESKNSEWVNLSLFDNIPKPADKHTIDKGNGFAPEPNLDDEIPF